MVMDPEIKGSFDRIEELLGDLRNEYDLCLRDRTVSERARNITHEILEKARNLLDQGIRRIWDRHIAPTLTKSDCEKARVYFPITKDVNSFRSTLGRGMMSDLKSLKPDVYSFLEDCQPYNTAENKWMSVLADLATRKHIGLVPQKRIENERITASRQGGGKVSWNSKNVRFGSVVRILGAQVDPRTQMPVSSPGLNVKREIWVSFVLEDYQLNAMGFCQEVAAKTRHILESLLKLNE